MLPHDAAPIDGLRYRTSQHHAGHEKIPSLTNSYMAIKQPILE
jgi:hypothetical protein